MKKVKIFTSAGCSHCVEAKNYLASQSIAFEEINLSTDIKAGKKLVKLTGHSVVPQIQIDDQFIIGFDRQKIGELLKEN